eukprot:TRINITY_DN26182_c0_g1_i1.p1 TRINITY_DN26182_c0_g1~~TRINITY_DN26182_c0_g1_i1.p1  ORF type:complete len:246 (-),score=27.78 TRINITY_DN26182_c0_g1_i1:191-928(-)
MCIRDRHAKVKEQFASVSLKKGSLGSVRRRTHDLNGTREHLRTISHEPSARNSQAKNAHSNWIIEQRKSVAYSSKPFVYLANLITTKRQRYTTISKSQNKSRKQGFLSKANARNLHTKLKRLESSVHSLEKTVTALKAKKSTTVKRYGSNQNVLSSYNILCSSVHDTYTNYSSLSKKVTELKIKEKQVFEKYVEACQEKEVAIANAKLEGGHQNTKLKLLEETLKKKNDEYSSVFQESSELVLFM